MSAASGRTPATAGRRSCNELGACQSRTPCCARCSWPLAPGTIDGPHRARRRIHWPRPQTVMVALLGVAALVALVVTISAAIGYLSVALQGGGL